MLESLSTKVDVNPEKPLPVACAWRGKDKPSRSLGFPFEANIVGLRQGQARVLIVSLDWIFVSPGMRHCILERCKGDLKGEELVLAASHTHTSPNPDRTKTGFSTVDPEYVERIENLVAEKVNELIRSNQWRTVRLRYGMGGCNYAIHRRRRVREVSRRGVHTLVGIAPNPDGPCDKQVRLMRVEDENGNLQAVIWGLSCHPNEWPRDEELSSDFPGGVRNAIRDAVGREIPVVFLQGFCGDLRPNSVGYWPKRGDWRARLNVIVNVCLNGKRFVRFTEKGYQRWLERIAASVKQTLEDCQRADPLETHLRLRMSRVPLHVLGLSGEINELIFQLIEINQDFVIAGISAEVCWGHFESISRVISADVVWPVGYLDAAFGYLPTPGMIAEGGYEVTHFMPGFGIRGKIAREVGQLVSGAFAQLRRE